MLFIRKITTIFLLMLFSFIFVFFGCSQSEGYCFFSGENNIELVCKTSDDTKELKLVANIPHNLSWDTKIIDYDEDNGIIKAKSAGSTYIMASFFKNNETQIQKVYVEVKEPVYAVDIELNDSYVFWVGSDNNEISFKTLTKNNQAYSFEYEYISLDENICSVVDNFIVAKAEGEAKLKVRAVCGFNSVTNQYEYIERETTIICQRDLKVLKVELLDENKNLLKMQNGEYNLFNGIREDKPVYYYLKVSSNASLKNYKIKTVNENHLWTDDLSGYVQATKEVISQNQILIPIRAKDFGKSNLSVMLVDSNDGVVSHSNNLKINVHKYLEDENIKLGTTKEYKEKLNCIGLKENDLTEFSQHLKTDKLVLYNITKANNTNMLAHNDKKYFYGLICFDNFDINCYTEISASAVNLEIEKISNNQFWFQTISSGQASITIQAKSIDDFDFSKTFSFEVFDVELESFEVFTQQNYNLKVGESVDLAPYNISPSYAVFYKSIETDSEILEISNFTVVGKAEGRATLTLIVCDSKYEYEILVYESEFLYSFCESEKVCGNEYSLRLTYLITNIYEEEITNVQVQNVLVDVENCYVWLTPNGINIYSSQQFNELEITFFINDYFTSQKTYVINWENT